MKTIVLGINTGIFGGLLGSAMMSDSAGPNWAVALITTLFLVNLVSMFVKE